MNDTRRPRLKTGVRQSTDIRFSNRGYPIAEQGNTSEWTGITPFFTDTTRPEILEVPDGVLIYNATTSGLQLSDRRTDTWLDITTTASGSPPVSSSGISTVGALVNYTTRFDGSVFVPAGNLLNDGTDIFIGNDLTISGNLNISGSVNLPNTLLTASELETQDLSVSGSFQVLTDGPTPTSSSDPTGTEGEVRFSGDYFYYKSGSIWRRAALSIF